AFRLAYPQRGCLARSRTWRIHCVLRIRNRSSGSHLCGERWKRATGSCLHVAAALQAVKGHTGPVVAPHFGNTEGGEDGKTVQGGAGQVDLDDQIRRRIDFRVQLSALCLIDARKIEGRVWLEALLQVLTLE